MNNFNPDKKYEAFKIPDRSRVEDSRSMYSAEKVRPQSAQSGQEDVFYEIEYDSCPMPGVGRFVLKSQKVEQPKRDEIRELFYRMRDIAHDYRPIYYASNKFYDKRVQQENARVFYKQGIFMKDFEDQYDKVVTYSSYYPNYQMMGYDQLRTYFTWRTQLRQGNVTEISLSYAYLYIYELLSNIGVEDAAEGLEKLLFFWRAYRELDASIDKYVVKWLKDYYIYYDIPGSFQEFLEKNDLIQLFPELNNDEDKFELYCGISRYDIRKSSFYTEDRVALIQACFEHTFNRLVQVFEEQGISLEEAVFQPTKKMATWIPFKGALFYDWQNQRNRRVVLSRKEIYICHQNNWTYSSVITTEAGKKLVGYVMKQMEVVLRKLTKYKFKLSADSSAVTHEAVKLLSERGISLEKVVTDAVTEFYREATKKVVKVDPGMLARIRQEAFITQEKLTVPEEDAWSFVTEQANRDENGSATMSASCGEKSLETKQLEKDDAWLQIKEAENSVVQQQEEECELYQQQTLSMLWQSENSMLSQQGETQKLSQQNKFEAPRQSFSGAPAMDVENQETVLATLGPWEELKAALTSAELQALAIICSESADIRKFADSQGIMLEVLMDGINEKAMDYVGDSLTDDEFVIYEDYIEEVRKMVEEI